MSRLISGTNKNSTYKESLEKEKKDRINPQWCRFSKRVEKECRGWFERYLLISTREERRMTQNNQHLNKAAGEEVKDQESLCPVTALEYNQSLNCLWEEAIKSNRNLWSSKLKILKLNCCVCVCV